MLVVCPCGKKLKVNESLAGKKVRCPACKEVFVARDQESDDEEERVLPGKNRNKRRVDEEEDSEEQDHPPRDKKRKAKAAKQVEDDEFDEEEDDEEEATGSRKKGKRAGPPTTGVPLWRKLVAGAVLGILLVVLVVIYVRAFAKPGTVVLEVNVPGVTVSVDGKKLDFPGVDEASMTEFTFDEPPGDHEITVSKGNYRPFSRKVTVQSGITNKIQVLLLRN